ncbi:MAG: hypothetical protein LUD72_14695 [Bacteroidales bacterium]|nr:hypothetical protein [Bacteroidales bacterium]
MNTQDTSWIQTARESGTPLWEKQIDETDDDYQIWCTYRDIWPESRPTVSKTAELLSVPVRTVQKAYNRWAYNVRLQAWIREVTADDASRMRSRARRAQEQQLSMAADLREKLATSIDALEPEQIPPTSLSNLLRTVADLEESATDTLQALSEEETSDIDTADPYGLPAADEEGNDGRRLTAEQAAEVAGILVAAGVLPQGGTPAISTGDTSTDNDRQPPCQVTAEVTDAQEETGAKE